MHVPSSRVLGTLGRPYQARFPGTAHVPRVKMLPNIAIISVWIRTFPPFFFLPFFFLSNLTKESAHGSIQSQKPSARETLTIARRASSHESLNPETLARNVSTGTSSKRSTRSTTKGAAETGSQRALFLPAWGPPPRHQSTRGRCTGVAERAEKRQRPRSKSCNPPGVMARAPNLLRERCRDPPMNR